MDAEDEKAKSANVDKITKMAAAGYRAEDEEVSEMTGMRVTYREPVLQSMGTPGLPLPLIRNREYTAAAVTTEERLLTVLDPEAIKRRAEIYTRLLEESAVSGLAAAAAETAAQMPAEGAQPLKTDNEPQDTGNPVATPLQNAGNGQSAPKEEEPVKNTSRSEAATRFRLFNMTMTLTNHRRPLPSGRRGRLFGMRLPIVRLVLASRLSWTGMTIILP